MRAVFALCFALCLTSFAQAEKYTEVERRLGELVADGELTIDEAHRMMTALRQESPQPHSPRDVRQAVNQEIKHMKKQLELEGKRLKDAVNAANVSEEDAERRWAELETHMEAKMAELRLRAAVAEGELTKEEAREKAAAIHEKFEKVFKERIEKIEERESDE